MQRTSATSTTKAADLFAQALSSNMGSHDVWTFGRQRQLKRQHSTGTSGALHQAWREGVEATRGEAGTEMGALS